MKFVLDDAGRPPHLPPDYPDCAARAISIALGLPYVDAARDLLAHAGRTSFAAGIAREVVQGYLEVLFGWRWLPGDGLPLATSRLPMGRAVVWLRPVNGDPLDHVTCVTNGAVRDMTDCRAGVVVGVCMP